MKVPNQFPTVNLFPKIAIVGEAPGADEDRMGLPFVGTSGQLLDRLLNEVGIVRAGCFVGNVCQFRPFSNDISTINRDGPEWQLSIQELRNDLAKYEPDVTIALGETALNFLTGHSSITKWRGSILDIEGRRIIPSYHPAAVLRNWEWRPVLKFDLAKAKVEAKEKQPLPVREFNISPTLRDIEDYITKIKAEGKAVAFDIETVHHQITCLGMSNDPAYAIVIPFDKRWELDEEGEIWHMLGDLFENSGLPFVAQNAQYDMGVLKWYYNIRVNSLEMDTMLAHHACYPELPKSLAFQASIYTREPYYKHESKETDGNEQSWGGGVPKDQLYRYNAKDNCVTLECYYQLRRLLEHYNAVRGYRIDMDSLPLALEMTLRGIKVNHEKCRANMSKIDAQIGALSLQITEAFGRPINTKSPKQMKELLYSPKPLGLGYKPIETKYGAITTNADALIKLARREDRKELRLMLQERKLRTRRSFFEPDCHSDGRIHASFNVTGTETGRWASSASFLGGRNMMNIPQGCRDIYEADPGYVLVGFDKAQAEARCVAYEAFLYTGDDSYKTIIESGEKVHLWFGQRLVARGICPVPWDDLIARFKVPASPEANWYLIFKKSVHGFSYDLGPIKWADVVAVSTDGDVIVAVPLACMIKDALYQDIPAIPKRQAAIAMHLQRSRTMVNAFGRVRHFFGRGDDMLGEAYANGPQGTVADDVASSIRRIADELPHVQLLQQNYDSLMAQCPVSELDATLPVMKRLAEQPITLWDLSHTKSITFTIPAVMKAGPNWEDMEDLK